MHIASSKRTLRWVLSVSILLLLCTPALAQSQDADDDSATESRSLVPFGAPDDAVPANATIIDGAQFLSLLNQGTIHIATLRPGNEPDARRRRLDRVHELKVRKFLSDHPELTSLAAIVDNDPHPTKGLTRRDEDSWVLDLPQTESQVVTFGRSSKLTAIYNAIVFSEDRDANLNLYTRMFNSLPTGYLETNTDDILPSTLINASLGDIKQAISSVAAKWKAIEQGADIPLVIAFTGCQSEIGAGVFNLSQGDRAGNQDFCKPSSKGIYVNFDFPNKSYNTCVKNQGGRGVCHTFAVTSATELQISLKTQLKVNLSEQDLMEHYRLLWQRALQIESGDAFELANDVIATNYHQPYEIDWIFNPALQEYTKSGTIRNSCAGYIPGLPCSASAPEAPMVCTFLSFTTARVYCAYQDAGIPPSPYTLSSANRFWDPTDTEKSTESMALSLAFNSSVVMDLSLSPAFQGAKNGYVPYSDADLKAPAVGGHIVHVIGFIGNNELSQKLPTAPPASGGGYFIVKNSWGTCVGDGGYYYVPWDYVKARVQDAFSIGALD
jgi:Papain family cysteine protease